MILQNFTFPGVITLPDKIPFPPEKTAFLDLETKAFGRKNSRILYLGLIFQENGTWQGPSVAAGTDRRRKRNASGSPDSSPPFFMSHPL